MHSVSDGNITAEEHLPGVPKRITVPEMLCFTMAFLMA